MEELDAFISEERQKKDDLSAYKYLGVAGREEQRKGRDSNQSRQKPGIGLGGENFKERGRHRLTLQQASSQ